MSLIEKDPQQHAAHTTDFIYHVLFYAVVMIVFAVIAFFMESWGWMVAAMLGWGMVVLGQAVYVFLWEPRGSDTAGNAEAVKTLVDESRKITPGA